MSGLIKKSVGALVDGKVSLKDWNFPDLDLPKFMADKVLDVAAEALNIAIQEKIYVWFAHSLDEDAGPLEMDIMLGYFEGASDPCWRVDLKDAVESMLDEPSSIPAIRDALAEIVKACDNAIDRHKTRAALQESRAVEASAAG